jgi:pyrroloquinoline quinone (PQQ) biosynthesis protein C
MLHAGRGLLGAMTKTFGASDPFEGVGALMVSEIFAKKMDRCVGDEVRRQSALSRETLTWLDLHEHLEVEHAEDSYELAELVPERGPQLSAAWRGARAEWNALWGFLDDVYATHRLLRATG